MKAVEAAPEQAGVVSHVPLLSSDACNIPGQRSFSC